MSLTRQRQQNSIVCLVSFQNKIPGAKLGMYSTAKREMIYSKHTKQPNNETISLHSSCSTTAEAQKSKQSEIPK